MSLKAIETYFSEQKYSVIYCSIAKLNSHEIQKTFSLIRKIKFHYYFYLDKPIK